jgi:anti-sigma factor RsiW
MTNHGENQCDWLDDYLVGEMPPARKLDFEQHLAECATCQSEVDQWAAMSGMLKTATRELESPSAALVARIERERSVRIQRNRRRIVGWSVATVVAACLLFATRFIEFERPTSSDEPRKENVVAPHRTEIVSPSPLVELPENVIGVPIDIGEPNVTVVWIYPTAQIPTAQIDSEPN